MFNCRQVYNDFLDIMKAFKNKTIDTPGVIKNVSVRPPHTIWTILQNDDPDHLGLRCNAFPAHQMARITSGCVPVRLCSADTVSSSSRCGPGLQFGTPAAVLPPANL